MTKDQANWIIQIKGMCYLDRKFKCNTCSMFGNCPEDTNKRVLEAKKIIRDINKNVFVKEKDNPIGLF